jgi:hypothetical protein
MVIKIKEIIFGSCYIFKYCNGRFLSGFFQGDCGRITVTAKREVFHG